jgi:hypothetical protein
MEFTTRDSLAENVRVNKDTALTFLKDLSLGEVMQLNMLVDHHLDRVSQGVASTYMHKASREDLECMQQLVTAEVQRRLKDFREVAVKTVVGEMMLAGEVDLKDGNKREIYAKGTHHAEES